VEITGDDCDEVLGVVATVIVVVVAGAGGVVVDDDDDDTGLDGILQIGYWYSRLHSLYAEPRPKKNPPESTPALDHARLVKMSKGKETTVE